MGFSTTLEFIENEESRLNTAIPDVIKPLLLENNGGSECFASGELWWLFAVKDNTTRKHIKRTANHIERETQSAIHGSNFPKDAIALGENGSGDLLIALKGSQTIFIWKHETGKLSETTLKPI